MTSDRQHGGDLSALTIDGQQWLDLSTGINPAPYPWQQAIPASTIAEAAQALPQRGDEKALVDAFCTYADAPNREDWMVGPGSQALIEALPRLFSPGQPVVIPHPTYNEHAYTWRRAGFDVFTPSSLPRQFADRAIVIVTNPNNPDGRTISPAELLKLADTLAQTRGHLIVDEAFVDLTPELSLASHDLPGNIILLRSFGKFFGLAGMRIGLLRCPPAFAARSAATQPLWAVSGPALVVAEAAYKDSAWIRATRQRLARNMAALRDCLEAAGLAFVGGTDLYCLIEHPRAQALFRHLQTQAIHVRRFDYNDTWLRFGLAPDGDLSHLETALKGDWTDD